MVITFFSSPLIKLDCDELSRIFLHMFIKIYVMLVIVVAKEECGGI